MCYNVNTKTKTNDGEPQMSVQVKVSRYYTFEKPALLEALQVSNVLTSYTGKTGCMCGCNGNYYVTAESRSAAEKDRGYAHDDKDVSPKAVARAVNGLRMFIGSKSDEELQAAIDSGVLCIAADMQYIGTEINGRNRFVYFNSKVHKVKS